MLLDPHLLPIARDLDGNPVGERGAERLLAVLVRFEAVQRSL